MRACVVADGLYTSYVTQKRRVCDSVDVWKKAYHDASFAQTVFNAHSVEAPISMLLLFLLD